MPYDAEKSSDVKSVQEKLKRTYKNVSDTAARQAIHVFNSVMEGSNDEGRAWASVYSKMNERNLSKKKAGAPTHWTQSEFDAEVERTFKETKGSGQAGKGYTKGQAKKDVLQIMKDEKITLSGKKAGSLSPCPTCGASPIKDPDPHPRYSCPGGCVDSGDEDSWPEAERAWEKVVAKSTSKRKSSLREILSSEGLLRKRASVSEDLMGRTDYNNRTEEKQLLEWAYQVEEGRLTEKDYWAKAEKYLKAQKEEQAELDREEAGEALIKKLNHDRKSKTEVIEKYIKDHRLMEPRSKGKSWGFDSSYSGNKVYIWIKAQGATESDQEDDRDAEIQAEGLASNLNDSRGRAARSYFDDGIFVVEVESVEHLSDDPLLSKRRFAGWTAGVFDETDYQVFKKPLLEACDSALTAMSQMARTNQGWLKIYRVGGIEYREEMQAALETEITLRKYGGVIQDLQEAFRKMVPR